MMQRFRTVASQASNKVRL